MLENFKTHEFFDKETYELLGDKAMSLLDIRLKMTIDSIRKKLGYSMIINNWANGGQFSQRGFRTQKSTTGAKDGSHYKGMGVDFDCYDKGKLVNADEIRKKIMKNIDVFPYIRGCEVGINWNHWDVMGEEDSDKRKGVNDKTILLYSPKTGSKVISRNDIQDYA